MTDYEDTVAPEVTRCDLCGVTTEECEVSEDRHGFLVCGECAEAMDEVDE